MKSILFSIYDTLKDLFNPNNAIYKAAIAAWLFVSGIHTFLFAILALSLTDVITGCWAAVRNGERITSRRLKEGLLQKTALYLIMMLTAFVLDHVFNRVLPFNDYYMAFVLTLLISVYEVTSIIENVARIDPKLSFLRRFGTIFQRIADRQIEGTEQTLGRPSEDDGEEQQ